MKPYLVEDIEEKGVIVEKRGPSILNSAICSKAVADTVTRALIAVTEEGTAKRLKDAKCTVAGKTGTSFAVIDGRYNDVDGRKKYQGTFVGFFPAEDPQYSVICVVYSKPTIHHYQGGGIPAKAIKTVVDNIYNNESYWQEQLSSNGQMPDMQANYEVAVADNTPTSEVPDLKGMGLKDAIYLIENKGLKCEYTGTGHVKTQTPAAGKTVNKGSTVSIELK